MAPGTGFTHTVEFTPGAAAVGSVLKVGADDGPAVETTTVMDWQFVILHEPSARTK